MRRVALLAASLLACASVANAQYYPPSGSATPGTGTGALVGASGATLTGASVNGTTLTGGSGTITVPSGSSIMARTDANQTFTGSQGLANSGNSAWNIGAASGYKAGGAGWIITGTNPTITAGFGTSPSISGNGSVGLYITVGASPSGTASLTFQYPGQHGYACSLNDQTNNGSIVIGQVAGGSTTVSNFQAYSRTTGATTNFVAGDIITGICMGN